MQLAPDAACIGQCSSRVVLPPATRRFGRLIDDSQILPGDLLLTRPVPESAEWISKKIVEAQASAFAEEDAQWTHAAVCLGDGENICEANFGVAGKASGVIVRPLNEYADGHHVIRVRRPIGLTDQQRLRVAIGALTNLRKTYSLGYLLRLAWRARTGKGLWDPTHPGITVDTNAVVCSTLYADALQYAANIAVGRQSNLCIPALLSSSSLFDDDVPIGWLELS